MSSVDAMMLDVIDGLQAPPGSSGGICASRTDEALAEALGQLKYPGPDALVKRAVFALHPVGADRRASCRTRERQAPVSTGMSSSSVRSGVTGSVASSESSSSTLDVESAPEPLIGDGRVEVAVAQDRLPGPRRRGDDVATCWARSALISSASASGSMCSRDHARFGEYARLTAYRRAPGNEDVFAARP